MKTIYFGATSIDGFIADKSNSLDWLFQFDEPKGNYINNFLAEVGVIAMGSTTYRWILDHPISTSSSQSWPYRVPTFVFTTRSDVKSVEGADIRFVSGSVEAVHSKMRDLAQKKNIWIMGGGELAARFHDANLLDEICLQIAPVTLGGGAPVFPRHLKVPFQLVSARPLDGNFVEVLYKIAKA